MFRFVVFTSAAAAALGQHVALDERDARIVKEQRFNNGDGRTGAAFATENEILFKEESDAEGTRFGQYSYIGDDGKTYFIKYSAGKDGFRILDGDHIPSTGRDAAPFVSEAGDGSPAAPGSAPVQRPSAPVAAPVRPAPVRAAPQPAPIVKATPVAIDYDYTDEPVDPNFNPFINPHDPTHRNFAFNKQAAKFAPKVPGVLDASDVPNCAGCEGLNPFINPFDGSHQAGSLAGHQAGLGAGIPTRQAARPVAPAAPALRARPAARPQQPAFQLLETEFELTTAAPRRFFPPGKIALNRFETGFNFDFSS